MNYDIEADWQLLSTCNYRCDYCFLSPDALGSKMIVHATPEQWSAAFDRTGKTWLVHMSGGEPSHYPDFVTLSEKLIRRHWMSLNSNLTGAALLDFAVRIDPGRVSFINAGVHPEERARRNGLALFLRHSEALLARGFPLMATVVATPNVLRAFDAVTAQLAPVGLVPMPKLLRGRYRGRRYPEAYTAEERALFEHHSEAAERAYAGVFAHRCERPSVDPRIDRDFLGGIKSYLGKPCTAGFEMVRLLADGTVMRCGRGESMGNLLRGTARFRDGGRAVRPPPLLLFLRKVHRPGAAAGARPRAPDGRDSGAGQARSGGRGGHTRLRPHRIHWERREGAVPSSLSYCVRLRSCSASCSLAMLSAWLPASCAAWPSSRSAWACAFTSSEAVELARASSMCFTCIGHEDAKAVPLRNAVRATAVSSFFMGFLPVAIRAARL
jgi:hypothetical protein